MGREIPENKIPGVYRRLFHVSGPRARQTPVKTAVGAGGEGTFSGRITFGPKLRAFGRAHSGRHSGRSFLI